MEAKRVRKKRISITTRNGLDDHLYEYALRIYGTFALLRTWYIYFNAYWNVVIINLVMRFYFKIVKQYD